MIGAMLAPVTGGQVTWSQTEVDPAPVAAHVDHVEQLDPLVEHGPQSSALPDRADAAEIRSSDS